MLFWKLLFVLLTTCLASAKAQSLSFRIGLGSSTYYTRGAYSCANGSQLGLPVGNWPVGRVSNTLQEAIDGAHAQHRGSCEQWRVNNPVDHMNAGFLTEDMDFLVCAGLYPTLSCPVNHVMMIWWVDCSWMDGLTGRMVRDPCTSGVDYQYLNVDTTETEAQGIIIPENSACAIDNNFALCCDGQDPQACRPVSPTPPPTPSPTPPPTPPPTPSPTPPPTPPPVTNSNPPPTPTPPPTIDNNSGGGTPTSNNGGSGGSGPTEPDVFNINLNQEAQKQEEDDGACNSDCVSAICSVLGLALSGLLGFAGFRHQKKKREGKEGGDTATSAGTTTTRDVSFGGPVSTVNVNSDTMDDGDVSTIGGESLVRGAPPPQSSSLLGAAPTNNASVADADSSATPKMTPSKKKKKKKSSVVLAPTDDAVDGDDVDENAPTTPATPNTPSKKKKKKKKSIVALAPPLDNVEDHAPATPNTPSKKKKKKKKSIVVSPAGVSTIGGDEQASEADSSEANITETPKKKKKKKKRASDIASSIISEGEAPNPPSPSSPAQ